MIVLLRYVTFALLVCLVSTQERQNLSIGAFNIKALGRSKMNNTIVARCIAETVSRYDVILIEEIRDSRPTDDSHSMSILLNRLNNANPVWNVTMSEDFGKPNSRYKERYAYFYKNSTIKLVNATQWPTTDRVFERPPYIARFKSTVQPSFEFGFIGVHTRPINNSNNHTINEINKLVDVYDSISVQWNLKDFIIGGDFNAGRKLKLLKNSTLRNDRFKWTIGDDVKTAVKSNNAYDRLVLIGDTLKKHYFSDSATAYTYDDNESCKSLAKNISDHYPVELSLIVTRENIRSVTTTFWPNVSGGNKRKNNQKHGRFG